MRFTICRPSVASGGGRISRCTRLVLPRLVSGLTFYLVGAGLRDRGFAEPRFVVNGERRLRVGFGHRRLGRSLGECGNQYTGPVKPGWQVAGRAPIGRATSPMLPSMFADSGLRTAIADDGSCVVAARIACARTPSRPRVSAIRN